METSTITLVVIALLILIALGFFFYFVPIGLWITALFSGVRVGIGTLIGMRLRKVNPGFDRSWVKQRWLHREPAAQPIVTVGYPDRIPPLQTGVPHLILANTTQIYPEDRGTNYSVRLGNQIAALVAADLAREPVSD